MSRTNKGGKGWGYEYWSRRPGKHGELGKVAKRRTHKAERRGKQKDIKELQ